MVLLLGSRGRVRGRSGSKFVDTVRGIVAAVFGRTSSRRRDDMRPRARMVPGWWALAAALTCLVGGFFAGDHFARGKAATGAGESGLQAKGTDPRAPGFVDEVDARKLSRAAFIVSAYPTLPPAEAKAKAKALSDHLRGMQLDKARPCEYAAKDGPLWVVAVYYDGDSEFAATRDKLRLLPADVPDATFVQLRNTEAEWPKAWPIR